MTENRAGTPSAIAAAVLSRSQAFPSPIDLSPASASAEVFLGATPDVLRINRGIGTNRGNQKNITVFECVRCATFAHIVLDGILSNFLLSHALSAFLIRDLK